MIVLKLTRTINDGTKKNLYKTDTHSDIDGYNSLLKEMMRSCKIRRIKMKNNSKGFLQSSN